jgi:hypothetical protein
VTSTENNESGKGTVEEFMASLTIGEPGIYNKLTVFPLFSGMAVEDGYMLLDDALKTDKVHITELSEGGSVPDLYLENGLTDMDLLLIQGDLLIGAKQNRTLNATIIVNHGVKMKIPVSCVERGRWSYKSKRFSSSKEHLYPSLRKKKSASMSANLKKSAGGSFMSDQSEVWDEIDRKQRNMRSSSSTDSVNDIYQDYEKTLDEWEKNFIAVDGQVGFVASISGTIVGIEAFGTRSIFPKAFKKLLRGYMLDAMDEEELKAYDRKAKAEESTPEDAARRTIDRAIKLKKERFKSMGAGQEVRFEGKDLDGFAVVDDSEHVVHLAVFP